MKIATNAGHSSRAKGASSSNYQEHELTRAINAVFMAEAKKRGVTVIDCTSDEDEINKVVNEQVRLSNASGADLAIAHHFNSNPGEPATGVEVLYWHSNKTTQALAKAASSAIAKHYGLRNRGAKGRDNLGFLKGTKMPALLIEWGFINNQADMDKVLKDLSGGVNALLDALGAPKASHKPSNTKPAPAPAKPAPKPAPKPAAKPVPKPKEPKSRLLKVGVRGSDVKLLQEKLNLRGYRDNRGLRLKVDGIFGERTKQALMRMQRRQRIGVDGLAGKQSFAKLGIRWVS